MKPHGFSRWGGVTNTHTPLSQRLAALLILTGFATILLVVVAPEPAHAYSHGDYRWKYANVCVIDHTSSRWPVSSAMYRWNKTPDLSHRYGKTWCAQKIHVYENWYGRTGWHGHAYPWKYSRKTSGSYEWLGDTWRSYRCTIRMNNSYYLSWANKRRAIMHELGHCDGLRHTSASALMNTRKWRWYSYPTYDDKLGVERRYPW